MKQRRKLVGMIVMAVLLMVLAAAPVYAASRKRINSVSVVVTSDILPETKYGDENVEVEVRSGRCSYDYYDIENVGFEWTETDVPEITIYLRADDGYYFSLTNASSVKLTGATYVKATKQDSSESLVLTVKLPSLAESVGEQTDITLSEGGYAVWDPVRGAGSYEVRLYRNGTGMNVTILTTPNDYYDFSSMMGKPGSYQVKVRPINAVNTDNKGEWKESQGINVTQEMAEAIRSGSAVKMPVRGTWNQDDKGWWYRHNDGSYTTNNWEQIKELWYFFDENGYMKTGWVDWNGKQYYCDTATGKLLTNTVTPDGYVLDNQGCKKNS